MSYTIMIYDKTSLGEKFNFKFFYDKEGKLEVFSFLGLAKRFIINHLFNNVQYSPTCFYSIIDLDKLQEGFLENIEKDIDPLDISLKELIKERKKPTINSWAIFGYIDYATGETIFPNKDIIKTTIEDYKE